MIDRRDQVTRRQVLIGTGAAALGAVAFGSSKAHAAGRWDHDADIVVVGSGAGASTAAIIAHGNGDKVVAIDKAPIGGGTTAKSAGVLWIPNNFTLKARGISDEKGDCLRFLARFSYPERYNASQQNLGLSSSEYSLLEAFYDNASPMIDKLRASGDFTVAEWRMFALDRPATDYLDSVPENKVPAGRAASSCTGERRRPLGAVWTPGRAGVHTVTGDQGSVAWGSWGGSG